jgi:hypothetical protein
VLQALLVESKEEKAFRSYSVSNTRVPWPVLTPPTQVPPLRAGQPLLPPPQTRAITWSAQVPVELLAHEITEDQERMWTFEQFSQCHTSASFVHLI